MYYCWLNFIVYIMGYVIVMHITLILQFLPHHCFPLRLTARIYSYNTDHLTIRQSQWSGMPDLDLQVISWWPCWGFLFRGHLTLSLLNMHKPHLLHPCMQQLDVLCGCLAKHGWFCKSPECYWCYLRVCISYYYGGFCTQW